MSKSGHSSVDIDRALTELEAADETTIEATKYVFVIFDLGKILVSLFFFLTFIYLFSNCTHNNARTTIALALIILSRVLMIDNYIVNILVYSFD